METPGSAGPPLPRLEVSLPWAEPDPLLAREPCPTLALCLVPTMSCALVGEEG